MKSLPSTKSSLLAALAVFMVIFNLGYVFHDLLLGEWFHQQQPFAREHYIIPYIALLENGQREDGSVELPSALVPYMGGATLLEA